MSPRRVAFVSSKGSPYNQTHKGPSPKVKGQSVLLFRFLTSTGGSMGTPSTQEKAGSTETQPQEDDLTAFLKTQEEQRQIIEQSLCSEREKANRRWFVWRDPYLA